MLDLKKINDDDSMSDESLDIGSPVELQDQLNSMYSIKPKAVKVNLNAFDLALLDIDIDLPS